ncbi:MAG: hypothetical protein JWO25_1921 [Alphaproteobacteria bacterium]|nr:hypothetical protein [Alphaproteobacteria bacterium]
MRLRHRDEPRCSNAISVWEFRGLAVGAENPVAMLSFAPCGRTAVARIAVWLKLAGQALPQLCALACVRLIAIDHRSGLLGERSVAGGAAGRRHLDPAVQAGGGGA